MEFAVVLLLLAAVSFLITNVVMLIRKKKSLRFGILSMTLNPFFFIVDLIFFIMLFFTSSELPAPNESPSVGNAGISPIIPITACLICAANIVLSYFILPKTNKESGGKDGCEGERSTEMQSSEQNHTTDKIAKTENKEGGACPDCNNQGEIAHKNFAGQTEKLIGGVGTRRWYRVISNFVVTYKCPQCGKTWTLKEKEETGKKVKHFDKSTNTWLDTDI